MVSFQEQRKQLVRQLKEKGVLRTGSIIRAFLAVPRELFVGSQKGAAYEDSPLPIGFGQTISAPHMVAEMTELLSPRKADTMLEIGAGSGYQAAILSRLVKKVVSLEIIPELCVFGRENLKKAGITNVEVICGGLEAVPQKTYDGIIISCAAPVFPRQLDGFLKEGGKLLVPVGKGETQELLEGTKAKGRWEVTRHGWCSFVPLQG